MRKLLKRLGIIREAIPVVGTEDSRINEINALILMNCGKRASFFQAYNVLRDIRP